MYTDTQPRALRALGLSVRGFFISLWLQLKCCMFFHVWLTPLCSVINVTLWVRSVWIRASHSDVRTQKHTPHMRADGLCVCITDLKASHFLVLWGEELQSWVKSILALNVTGCEGLIRKASSLSCDITCWGHERSAAPGANCGRFLLKWRRDRLDSVESHGNTLDIF